MNGRDAVLRACSAGCAHANLNAQRGTSPLYGTVRSCSIHPTGWHKAVSRHVPTEPRSPGPEDGLAVSGPSAPSPPRDSGPLVRCLGCSQGQPCGCGAISSASTSGLGLLSDPVMQGTCTSKPAFWKSQQLLKWRSCTRSSPESSNLQA